MTSTPTRRGPYRDALHLAALPGEWRFEAACTPKTGDLFLPTPKGDTRSPKDICATCPVRKACLEHALAHDERGIWGGLTGRERKALLRRRQEGAA